MDQPEDRSWRDKFELEMREYAIFIRTVNNVSPISSYSDPFSRRSCQRNYIHCDLRVKIIYLDNLLYKKFVGKIIDLI